MTREDIIRMAREAGHAIRNIDGEDEVMDGDNYHIQTELIERFAALVAAAEREACAKVAELVAREIDDTNGTASYIVAAIQARGEK